MRVDQQSCSFGSTKLILCDTIEIDFKREVEGIGPVGQGTGRGFFLHTGLMRDADSAKIEGVAGQVLFHRKPRSKRVPKNSKRRDPQRESIAWGQLIDRIGPPPTDVNWIHVCDRGADDYEVYCRAFRNQCGWVVRVARLNRKVDDLDGTPLELKEHIAKQPVQGTTTLEVPRQGQRHARQGQVSIRFAPLRMPTPSRGNEWIKTHAPEEPILMWVVELKEERPPQGVEPLHWVLLTSEVIASLNDAQECLNHYKLRWGVEEYHKALKTGCRVEQRYYETAARLERVTGMFAVLAVRLLQIRSLADEDSDQPANDVIPTQWVNVLARVRKRTENTMTIGQFVRHLAGLGGHLGRKRDGRPGWITRPSLSKTGAAWKNSSSSSAAPRCKPKNVGNVDSDRCTHF